jgi:predicted patatin/cPLA2 family phospholipase
MHSVIEHLSARKNKKPPFKDGRKIALLNCGGALSGARGTGVLAALQDLGMTQAFDQIYSLSAGFPNTAFFLTGSCEKGLEIYKSLPSKKFINFFRFWNIENSNLVVEAMKKSKSINISKLFTSPTQLFVGLRNLSNKQFEYFDVKNLGKDSYYQVLKACISMPFFSRGSISIGNYKYKDFNKVDFPKHIDHILKQNVTDLLVIYNNRRQNKIPGLFSDKIFEVIPPREWKPSRFKSTSRDLSREFKQMRKLTSNIFRAIITTDDKI